MEEILEGWRRSPEVLQVEVLRVEVQVLLEVQVSLEVQVLLEVPVVG